MIKQLWRVYTLLHTYLSLYLSIKLYIYKHIYLLSLSLSVALFVLFYIVYAYVCMCCQHIHANIYIYLYIPIYHLLKYVVFIALLCFKQLQIQQKQNNSHKCVLERKEYPYLLRPTPPSRSIDWPPVADTFVQR